MSIELGKLGWWKPTDKLSARPQKVVLPKPDGSMYVLVAEFNAAQPFAVNAAYGDGSGTNRLKIFNVTVAGVVTQVFNANVTPWLTPAEAWSADLYEDNSIGFAYVRQDNGNVSYRKITQGTWVLGSQETVATPANEVLHLDLSISQGDSPAVAFIQKNAADPKLLLRTYTRSSGGTWAQGNQTTLLGPTDPNNAMSGVSIQWVRGGTATARPLTVVSLSAQNGGSDRGAELYTAVVNESTGNLVNWTKRKTYLAGNQTTSWGTMSRRTYLFSSGTNEITVAHMEGIDKKTLMIARFTFDGSTFTETIPPQTSVANRGTIANNSRFAASYANNRVNFYYISAEAGILSAINFIGIIDPVAKTVRYSGHFKWDNLENGTNDRVYPMSGTGKNAYQATRHGMVYFANTTNGLYVARFHVVEVPPAPTEVTPAGGVAMITGTPALSAKIRLGKAYGQSKYKIVWQFATDAAFTASLRTYTQPDSKFVTVENTGPAASFVAVTDTLPVELALTSGSWYVRAAIIDEYGNQGAWKVASSGTGGEPPADVSHPPTATDLSPNSGAMAPTGAVTFIWKFNDPLPTDTQSAFQVIVQRVDTGATVYDSGKVSSTSEQHLGSLDAVALAGVLLRWTVTLWDSDDTAGPTSSSETFGIAGPPTVVINAPTDGSTVSSGTPLILFTPTVAGGRKIKAYEVNVLVNDVPVRSSDRVAVDVDSGTQLSWRANEPLLADGAYTVSVSVIDQTAMVGSDENAFAIVTVPAPTPIGISTSAANFNVEGAGYIAVNWSDANRDVDFEAWVIERKDDMLGNGTTVVETGTWHEIAEVTVTSSGYLYKDYYAPSGYKVNYRVRQLVNRGGDRALSTGEPVSVVYPVSEGYWIIDPSDVNGSISAFRLANVTSDQYSPEIEQTEVIIVGWGRHIDQGDYLGVKGSLSAQLRTNDASTARQKKRQLEDAQKTESALYLRNPFGDVYLVNLGNLSISRIAGVGRDEFVDVEIPYSEVGSD